MRIKSVSIRGATGLYKGLGQDVISLDLSGLPPGVIVICGDNGAGKSTLLECMPPMFLPSLRSKTIYDNFQLPDSERVVVAEIGGEDYTFRLLIDPSNRTTQGFILKGEESLTTGRMGEYNKVIGDLFGSTDVFAKTVFAAQAGIKFKDLPRSERKQFISTILNIAKYEGLHSKSSSYQRLSESEIQVLTTRIETLEPMADTTGYEGSITEAQNYIGGANQLIEQKENNLNLLMEDITEKRHELKGFQEKRQEKEGLHRLRDGIEPKLTGLHEAHQLSETDINGRLSRIDREMADAAALAGKRASLEKQHTGLVGEVKDHRSWVDLKNRISSTTSQYNQSLEIKKRLDGEIDRFKSAVSDKIPCFEDQRATCPLFTSAEKDKPSQDTIDKNAQEIDDLRILISSLERNVNELGHINANAEIELEQLKPLLDKAVHADDMIPEKESTKSELTHLQNERTETYQAAVMELQNQENDIEKRLLEIGDLDDVAIRQDINTLGEQAERIELGLKHNRELRSEHEQKLATLRAEYDVRKKNAERVLEAKIEKELNVADEGEWKTLTGAFGMGGIPTLKMEHAFSLIETITNDVLKEAFGSTWTIQFKTQKESAGGDKMLESLDLIVSHDGIEQPIETLSGGEDVWISQAFAMAVALHNRANYPIDTLFLDERDGALTADNRIAFYRVLESALRYDLHHIFLISHDPVIQEMAESKIVFHKDGIEVI